MFSYGQEAYKKICQIYDKYPNFLHNSSAIKFAQYTVKHNDRGHGYIAGAGNICLASKDSALTSSIEDGLWMENHYLHGNSIFAPYLNENSIDVGLAIFSKRVPIEVQLYSLSIFAEFVRGLIWQRVFKGAMYSLYADNKGVAPYFPNDCPYDLNAVYEDSDITGEDGDLLSLLATPTVNIFKEVIDLGSIIIRFPDIVKHFSTFSNVLHIPESKASLEILGSSTADICSHIIFVEGGKPNAPNLRMSNAAYSDIKNRMCCGQFYGGLRLTNSDESKSLVVMNGIVFEADKGKVSVTSDLRSSPPKEVLNQHLTDVQFSLIAAEARVNFLLSRESSDERNAALQLIHNHLLWLGGVAGECTALKSASYDPVSIQARALYLAHMVAKPAIKDAGVFVPYLKYNCYKDTIDSVVEVLKSAEKKLSDFQEQIRDRKQEERQVARDNTMNNNIKKTGQLLSEYIAAQAKYEEDMSKMFESFIKEKQEDLDALYKREDDLAKKVTEQRTNVSEAVEKYKKALKEWERDQMIKAGIEIALNLFKVGFVPSGAADALSSLGKVVQRIQKAIEIIEAIMNAYNAFKNFPKNPQDLINALNKIGPNGLELPTSLEWDEMHIHMSAILKKSPDNIDEASEVADEFEILVLRGKALIDTQNEIQAILSELAAAYANKRVHDEQRNRLSKMGKKFADPGDLDMEVVDLIGLSGQLIFFQRKMLAIMASTVVIQARALQYEYLQTPAPPKSFSFSSLQVSILIQKTTINHGLEKAMPAPEKQSDPLVYVIRGVPPDLLTNNYYSFQILLSKQEFHDYNYVRVEKIDVEIGGISFTESGKYYVELLFDGKPFKDRDFDGEPITFRTVPRQYSRLHYIENSSHYKDTTCQAAEKLKPIESHDFLSTTGVKIADNPFDGKISNITPFSTWKISLPKVDFNRGIKFSGGGVTVRLIFHVYAQLKATTTTASERAVKAFYLRTRDIVVPPHIRNLFSNVPSAESITKERVLGDMKNQSICNDWDAVFSITAKQVNKNLADQYENRKADKKYFYRTERVEHVTGSKMLKQKTVFQFEFGAVKLQFQTNNDKYAKVWFPIKSGFVEGWVKYEEYPWKKDPEKCFTVKESDGYSITASIPLKNLPGDVDSHMKICLSLSDGRYSADEFTPPNKNPYIDDALNYYFTECLPKDYYVYTLGTLDKEVKTLLCLTPKHFLFYVHHCPDSHRDILHLFITTTGTWDPRRETILSTQEPLPSDRECSIIINSKVFFRDVIRKSFGGAGNLGLQLNGVEPNDNENHSKAWSASATAGSASGPFGDKCIDTGHIYNSVSRTTTYYEDYIRARDRNVTVSIKGMKFMCAGTKYDVSMSFSDGGVERLFDYGYRFKMVGPYLPGEWSEINYEEHKFKVTITMNANLHFLIEGTGQNQELKLRSVENIDTIIDGDVIPESGACSRHNDHHIQDMYLKTLRSTLKPKLETLFKQEFPAISLFALKNILFPAENFINLKEAYVPGDFVVFGKLSK